MTARPEDRSRSLARLTAARACSLAGVAPPHPLRRVPSALARPIRAGVGSVVPLGPNSASSVRPPWRFPLWKVKRACRGAYRRIGALVARRRPVRGPPPFVACTTAQRAGGCAPCRGPAGPRGRGPVWPLSAARVGPRAAMRGGCPHTLQGMRKKCRTAGPAGRPAPLRGRASRWPLGGFFARPADGAHFPLASFRGAGFWLPWLHPLARLPGSRECRGQGDCPLWGPASLGLVPRSVVLPPAFPWPSVSPFRRAVGGCRPLPPHGARPWAAPAARSGGNGIQKVQRLGERTKAGRTAQGTLSARLGAGSVRYQLRY